MKNVYLLVIFIKIRYFSCHKINFSAHEGEGKRHKCTFCDKSYGLAGNLRTHIKNAHEGNRVKNHKCDRCDKAFYQASKLKEHIDVIHEGLKPYKCDRCDKGDEIEFMPNIFKYFHEYFKPKNTRKLSIIKILLISTKLCLTNNF